MDYTLAPEPTVLDLFSPDFAPDGPDVLAAQDQSWYARTPVGIAVLRYEQAHSVLRDRRLGGTSTVYHSAQGVTEGQFVDWWQSSLLGTDDDRHARLTRLVSPAFRPARIEAMRGVSRQVFERLLDRLGGRTEVEAVTELTDPYPITVLSELLQVPPEFRSRVQEWTSTLSLGFGLQVAQHVDVLDEAIHQLYGTVDRLLDKVRAHPAEGLLSDLIAAEEEGDRLTEEELRAMVVGIFFAGHDTTRNQLARALVLFTEHPRQWELVAAQPQLVGSAVDEVLRLVPSVPVQFRTPRHDLDLEGVPLQVGTFIAVLVGAAHRDPRAYDDPTFRVGVERPPTLAFGGGVHACLGNALARVELEEALLALTSRYQPPVLAGPVEWKPPAGIFGPTALPIGLRPL